jgi:tRNA (cmo5U34)-methyltransferase
VTDTWSEDDSELYRRLAPVAVPDRAEQIATLLTLVPYAADDVFRIVELACGEGLLAAALLTAFPHAQYLGLDGSDSMRAATASRLAAFGARAATAAFDLAATDWLTHADGAGVVVSSLAVHHLPDDAKRALYRAACPRLSDDGALLLADLVAPARAEIADVFAGGWDKAVEEQARRLPDGATRAAAFRAARWNHYRDPDPVDQPSRLADQLLWLSEAGFAVADCFWLRGGHAIYGGYRQANAPIAGNRFAMAMEIAEISLGKSG